MLNSSIRLTIPLKNGYKKIECTEIFKNTIILPNKETYIQLLKYCQEFINENETVDETTYLKNFENLSCHLEVDTMIENDKMSFLGSELGKYHDLLEKALNFYEDIDDIMSSTNKISKNDKKGLSRAGKSNHDLFKYVRCKKIKEDIEYLKNSVDNFKPMINKFFTNESHVVLDVDADLSDIIYDSNESASNISKEPIVNERLKKLQLSDKMIQLGSSVFSENFADMKKYSSRKLIRKPKLPSRKPSKVFCLF